MTPVEPVVCWACCGDPMWVETIRVMQAEFPGLTTTCSVCHGRGLLCGRCGKAECVHCSTGKTAQEIINEDSR